MQILLAPHTGVSNRHTVRKTTVCKYSIGVFLEKRTHIYL
jgi:hypothetical protein